MYTAHVHFFTNLDLFCIDNARVIYRKIRYFRMQTTYIGVAPWLHDSPDQCRYGEEVGRTPEPF